MLSILSGQTVQLDGRLHLTRVRWAEFMHADAIQSRANYTRNIVLLLIIERRSLNTPLVHS